MIEQQSLSVSSLPVTVTVKSEAVLRIEIDAHLRVTGIENSLHVTATSVSVQVAIVLQDLLPETVSASSHLAMVNVSHG